VSLYELFRTLAQPSHALLLTAVLGFLMRPWSPRAGTVLLALGLGGLLAAGSLPLGARLAAPLEARFAPPQPPPARVDGVVLLGGFTSPEPTCDDGPIRLDDAAERLVETLVLLRRYPEARLLVTGGGWRFVAGCSEAERTARFLLRYGVDRERLLLETRSRNTRENALYARELVRPGPGETWLLVTSAVHMPRAVAAFRRVGFPVVPWPVDPIGVDRLGWPAVVDMPRRWRELDRAAHEWLGLLWYRWRGWIDG